MIQNDIYNWLDSKGTISNDLQNHLDHNLSRLGSMFYQPKAYIQKYPPSDLNYQISKGFISYSIYLLTDTLAKLKTANSEPISTQQFWNEYVLHINKVCTNKKFSAKTFLLMFAGVTFNVCENNKYFPELGLLEPCISLYIGSLNHALVSDPRQTSADKQQINNLMASRDEDRARTDEEVRLLELLSKLEKEKKVLNVVNEYKKNYLPDASITDVSALDTVSQIHQVLHDAITSDTSEYILESENVKTKMDILNISFNILVPADVQTLLSAANLLTDDKIAQKNMLRSQSYNQQPTYDTDCMLDIIF